MASSIIPTTDKSFKGSPNKKKKGSERKVGKGTVDPAKTKGKKVKLDYRLV